MKRMGAGLGLWVFLTALSVAAQAPEQRYEYVTLWKIKPGKGSEFVELIKKINQPVLERLLGEGVVLAWGIDETFAHTLGGDTHVVWWQMASYGAVQRVVEEIESGYSKLSAEELRSVSEKFVSIVESHRDLLLRHLSASVKPSSGARPFHWIVAIKVQPGKGAHFEELWQKYRQPGYEKALAAGHLLAYSLAVEEVHTEDPGYRYFWFAYPDLASRDKVRAVLQQGATEEERRQIEAQFQSITEPGAHRDLLFRALLYAAK